MVDPSGELSNTFRNRVGFMKTWKPASTPSNRDRLQLYALHKQSVTGDAPMTLPSSASGPEKAKYQAWRAKSGLESDEAMRLYLQESDRQLRVYGTASVSTTTQQQQQTPATVSTSSNGATTTTTSSGTSVPRGLAAIPLLCAAASESRRAYLRRLSQTTLETAWWRRQEPLCASTSSSISAIPELALIAMARFVEFISLSVPSSSSPLLATLVQAFLWPLHNCFLSLWIGMIVLHTAAASVWSILQTIVWGARRTGISLSAVWKDQVLILSESVSTVCDSHQAVTCRLVGLTLLPIPVVIGLLNGGRGFRNSAQGTMPMSGVPASLTLTCVVYALFLCITWWYWFLVLPWMASLLLGTASATGVCFALIEFAEL